MKEALVFLGGGGSGGRFGPVFEVASETDVDA
jgi:hypothetical protein